MFVSKNGYIIQDIYKDLKQAMEQHDYERACHWSVELIITGEIKNLISWLISLINTHYVTTNALFYEFINKKLQILLENKFKWKADIVKTTLAELIVCLSKEEPAKAIFYKSVEGNYREFIDSLSLFPIKVFPELDSYFTFFHGKELYSCIHHLYDSMLKSDSKTGLKIVHYILGKNTIPECETLKLSMQIGKCKNDSVWLLWEIIFMFLSRPEIEHSLKIYINYLFYIFCFEYQKKYKQERANILCIAYIVCIKKKQIQTLHIYDDLIANAGKNINILYEESLKNENTLKGNTKETTIIEKTKSIPSKSPSSKKNTSTMTETERKILEEKMKYLFVLTYKNPKSTLYSSRIMNQYQQQASFKTIHVNNMDEEKEQQPTISITKL
jgi:hypothetical protein